MTPAETSPTRSAGRCSPRVGALATPALYPALFSTPQFTWTFWGDRSVCLRHTAAQGGGTVGWGVYATLRSKTAHSGPTAANRGRTRARAAPYRRRPSVCFDKRLDASHPWWTSSDSYAWLCSVSKVNCGHWNSDSSLLLAFYVLTIKRAMDTLCVRRQFIAFSGK